MNLEKKDMIQYTQIKKIDTLDSNNFFIKREDLIPFCFGGNKVRKAQLFFEEIDRGGYDCVVTYGSSSSNHCRVIANMAAQRNMNCYIISPEQTLEETYNNKMMKLFGAEITICSVDEVHNTIENKLTSLKNQGFLPYFIEGGGHGNIGTQAYINCYEEIKYYEREHLIHFDYIFHASGTGTTQAGLVCGQLLHGDDRKIIGISIARKNPRGRDVVLHSIKSYLQEKKITIADNLVETATIFVDDYVEGGYGLASNKIKEVINIALIKYGIAMDLTYTGKAFSGMVEYIEKHGIKNKTILFIHTGGMPLFFDYLNK